MFIIKKQLETLLETRKDSGQEEEEEVEEKKKNGWLSFSILSFFFSFFYEYFSRRCWMMTPLCESQNNCEIESNNLEAVITCYYCFMNQQFSMAVLFQLRTLRREMFVIIFNKNELGETETAQKWDTVKCSSMT